MPGENIDSFLKKRVSIISENNKFFISGEINFANVMFVYQRSLIEFIKSKQLAIDFSQLQSCDSSVLALIIEWIKFAKEHHKPIQFYNLSADVLAIAKVTGLDHLIAT